VLFESRVQLFGDPGCAPAHAVVGGSNPGGMTDDAATVERGELGGNAPDEVSDGAAAGEKFR
jgi:hypothetical protein